MNKNVPVLPPGDVAMKKWMLTRRGLFAVLAATPLLGVVYPSLRRWFRSAGTIDVMNFIGSKESLRVTGLLDYSGPSGIYLRDQAGVWMIPGDAIMKIRPQERRSSIEWGQVVHVYVKEGAEIYEVRKWQVNVNPGSKLQCSRIDRGELTDDVAVGLLQSPVHFLT